MARFSYTALATDGTSVSGVEVAPSSGAAHVALRQRGLQPINVREKRSALQFEITRRRVNRKHLMHFSRQLAVFIKAGIPILDALEVITEETSDKLFKKALGGVIEALQSGDTFAGAAAGHAEAFPRFYVGILESAELTGNLDVVLEQLAEYIERDQEARRKVTSALMYPSIVMAMAIGVVGLLTGWVLPKFKTFFSSLHAKLPLPTRMLLGVADFVTSWWFLLSGGIVVLVVGGLAMFRSKSGRAKLDAIMLRVPVAGDLVRHAILERVCRILSSMLRAGVPLPEAMVVTAEATNNAVYRRGLTGVREEMLQGRGLAGPIAASGLFPGALRQMFRVGEDTGSLDQQLQTAAIYYDRELDYRIKRFTTLFEPAVIVAVGLIVGFVAVALVSAMYGIYHQVKIQ
jgi:type IV pilus assembly protein PilC